MVLYFGFIRKIGMAFGYGLLCAVLEGGFERRFVIEDVDGADDVWGGEHK